MGRFLALSGDLLRRFSLQRRARLWLVGAMFIWLLASIRSVVVTGFFFIHTLIVALIVIFISGVLRSRKLSDTVIRWAWGRLVLWLAGVQVEVRGLEHWPREGGFLIAFSHASWMDIVAMSAYLPKLPRFGAKIELYSIPFFGWAMRVVGMLPIERNNRNKVLRIYREAHSRAAAGECFALAPEGTRQRLHTIGRLKTGPFVFAVGAQIPMVGLLIAGALDVMPKGTWLLNPGRWRRKVIMQVFPPLSTQGLGDADIEMLQKKLLDQWQPTYEKLNQELGLKDPSP